MRLFPARPGLPGDQKGFTVSTHYPKRISRIKRKRSIGFRARMKSASGRAMINRKRRVGRSLNVADKGGGKPMRGK